MSEKNLQFEYNFIKISDLDSPETKACFNELGANGWELVDIISLCYQRFQVGGVVKLVEARALFKRIVG